jgi:Uma2 family endonuclease
MATAALPVMKADRTAVEEPLYEVVGGVRVELPEMAVKSNVIKSLLFLRVGAFVEQHHLGWPVCEAIFILDEEQDEQRRPDIAYVSMERWPLDREVPLEGEWAVVPDLAIEVSSTHDKLPDVLNKISDYFAFGVRQVWLVFPERELVYVYDSPTDVHILQAPQVLDSPELLPGFSLPLAELFRVTTSATS